MKSPLPINEDERLAELHALQILDTPPERDFDDLTKLASTICGTPISLMTLLDARRQWFKSQVGMPLAETDRDWAFCSHAILEDELMVVHDATADDRFRDNPLVVQDPNIRFYAGAPMVSSQGHPLGTLCVIDRVPRDLTEQQLEALRALSRQAVTQIELRRALRILRQREAELKVAKEAAESASKAERQRVVLQSIDAACNRLSQPLTPMTCALELLLRNGHATDPAEMREQLQQVLEWTREAGEVIHRLREVAQMRVGSYLDHLELIDDRHKSRKPSAPPGGQGGAAGRAE